MKPIYAALIAAFFTSAAHAEDKFLHYRLNNNVVITISSIACPMKQYVKDFPYAAVASRSDGQKLVGCFNKLDENYLRQGVGLHRISCELIPSTSTAAKGGSRTMNVQLCKSCGSAFDLDEFQDGYCDSCLPDSGEIEEPPAVDWDRVTGDCV